MASSVDTMEFLTSTFQVLQECAEPYDTPLSHLNECLGRSYSRSLKSHPDIQYFQRIKNTHHYQLHKSKQLKRTVELIKSRTVQFDPYSRSQLVARLKTFTVLNWLVPSEVSVVCDLLCARNGWSCLSFSVTNNCKNTLVCACCHKQLVVKFNDLYMCASSNFESYLSGGLVAGDSILSAKDYVEINKDLENHYLKQITSTGHGSSCIWRNFETPLDGVYYLRPHLNSSNQIWIGDYLESLKNLVENTMALSDSASNFQSSFLADDNDETFSRFILISNKLLLSKYYEEAGEELLSALSFTPRWIYKLAILGWSLNIQSFGSQLVLLLICSKCNKRLFLNSCNHAPVPKHDVSKIDKETNLLLSQSNVLSPCPNPITLHDTHHNTSVYDLDSHEEDEDDTYGSGEFDLMKEHKSYCSIIQSVDGTTPFSEYFIQMVVDCENVIDDQGNFINTDEMLIDVDFSKKRRRNSGSVSNGYLDVNEGLERLNKLRRIYFEEE